MPSRLGAATCGRVKGPGWKSPAPVRPAGHEVGGGGAVEVPGMDSDHREPARFDGKLRRRVLIGLGPGLRV